MIKNIIPRKIKHIAKKLVPSKIFILKKTGQKSSKETEKDIWNDAKNLSLEEKALAVLTFNTREATKGGKKFIFTLPSAKKYCFQWFWDSCFHAIAWTYFDIERAKEEIRSLLAWQHRDGFIPHVIFWDKKRVKRLMTSWHMRESKGRFRMLIPFFPKPNTSQEIQPPTIARAVSRIYEATGDKKFLRETVPKLNAYYRWLFDYRDNDKDGLISIISSLESGLDFSPAYDPVVGVDRKTSDREIERKFYSATWANKYVFNFDSKAILNHGPFNVEDVLVNSILAVNLDVLANLNKTIGQETNRKEFRWRSRQVSDALIEKCWDSKKKLFFNLCFNEEKIFPTVSVQSIFPIIIPWLPQKIVKGLVGHIENPKEFWLEFPLSSVSKSEYSFSEKVKETQMPLIWRGTTWVNTNWYIFHALKHHGYNELAEKLAGSTKRMVEKSGLREHYNPITGEGYGQKNFGWSTLVIDM